MIYCDRIKALREDNDISQAELAQFLNIAQNTLSQYENGKRELPISLLIALADYFNCSTDYILGRTNKRES